MTSGGEVERVPIKVVPYYVQPVEPLPEEPILDVEPEAQPRLRWIVGVFGLLIALATVIVHASAVTVAAGGDYAGGETLGYVAVALSIAAFIAGAIAILLNRGRSFGVAAVLIGALANPLVLLNVLKLVDSLGS